MVRGMLLRVKQSTNSMNRRSLAAAVPVVPGVVHSRARIHYEVGSNLLASDVHSALSRIEQEFENRRTRRDREHYHGN